MPLDRPPPSRPVQIGRYQILDRIGTGGMGAVYKALDVKRGREVALKVLAPDQAANQPNVLRRFQLEARYGRRFNHENVVSFYRTGTVNGIHYLALEYVNGIDLQEYVTRRGRLSPEEALHVIVQAARAIEHLDRHGIVHRDLKPSNFLVTGDAARPVVKLIDLGLACRPADTGSRMTLAGSSLGTVDYMAPEQAGDATSADVRSDMYSLGCTWFHLLAGRPPFGEGTLMERVYKQVHEPPPDVRRFNPDVPLAQAQVLRRMLAKSPAERYQTPAELLRDLEQLSTNAEPAKRKPAPARLPVPPAPRPDPVAVAPSDETPRPAVPQTAPPHHAAGEAPRFREDESKEWPDKPSARKRRRPEQELAVWVIAGSALVATAAGVALWIAFRAAEPRVRMADFHDAAAPPNAAPHAAAPATPSISPPSVARTPEPSASAPDQDAGPKPTSPAIPIVHNVDPGRIVAGISGARERRLYRPTTPIDVARLYREYRKPWDRAHDRFARGPHFSVSRSGASGPTHFASLAAACAAAPEGRVTTIEILDNGPLPEPGVAVRARALDIRAGKGFRPVIVWDQSRSQGPIRCEFLDVTDGDLSLAGLELRIGDGAPGAPLTLCRVTEGDFEADRCTFTSQGGRASSRTAVAFEGTRITSRFHCRFDRCLLRGAELTALSTHAAGSDILFEDCLLAGGRRPLLDLRVAPAVNAETLSLLRCTLVATQSALRVRPSSPDNAGSLHVRAWDTILARGTGTGDAAMMTLAGLSRDAVSWDATNSLYAGWSTLLTSPEGTVTDVAGWRSVWKRAEGDATLSDLWPAAAPRDPATGPASAYHVAGTAADFPATSERGPIGCDVAILPGANEGGPTADANR